MLAERFHLAYYMDDRPLPRFIVSVAKEGLKLTKAKAPDATGGCQGAQDKVNSAQYTITCTFETVEQFISTLN